MKRDNQQQILKQRKPCGLFCIDWMLRGRGQTFPHKAREIMVNDLRLFWFFPVLLALFIAGVVRGEMPEQEEGTIEELCSETGMKRLQKESYAKLPHEIKIILDRDYPGWIFSEGCNPRAPDDPPNRRHIHFIWGDFDGNGHKDYAVQIGQKGKWSVLALLKRAGKFKVYTLIDDSYPNEYLELYKKGEVGSYGSSEDDEQKTFVYSNDSIVVVWGMGGSASYIFKQGSFQELTLTD